MIKMLVVCVPPPPPPRNSQTFPLPGTAGVIDHVGGARCGIVVIINETVSREPQGMGPGMEDHLGLCEQTRTLAAMEAGLWVFERVQRMGWLAGF